MANETFEGRGTVWPSKIRVDDARGLWPSANVDSCQTLDRVEELAIHLRVVPDDISAVPQFPHRRTVSLSSRNTDVSLCFAT